MATNYVQASYQEIVDFSTVPNKVGVFGFHTPDSMKPVQMLAGFYQQFRQVRYLGCSVKIQPAATLPMDPLGVSFESSEASTDPRDLLNPLIVKGCHGETINNALDIAYRNSPDVGESVTNTFLNFDGLGGGDGTSAYYSALSDPSFKKYSVLQPFAMKGLHPLVHKVVGTMPIFPKQSTSIFGNVAYPTTSVDEESDYDYSPYATDKSDGSVAIRDGVMTRVGDQFISGTMFTSKMERLGWLDTVSRRQVSGQVLITPNGDELQSNSGNVPTNSVYKYNTIPRLFMSVMLTPPCYKSILTFRCVINHHFAFRGFATARYVENVNDYNSSYDDSLLTDLATASVASTSMEAINGEATTLTEGVM